MSNEQMQFAPTPPRGPHDLIGRRTATLAGALVFGMAIPASAQIAVSESVSVSASATVRIEVLIGSVEVVGSSSGQVTVTGTRGEDTEGIGLWLDGNILTVEVLVPERVDGEMDAGADLLISVPIGVSVDIQVLAVEVTVVGVTGAVTAEVASGSFTVRGAPSRVDAETLAGDIDVAVQGAPVRVSTAAGAITVTGAAGTVEAETLSGAITVEASDLDQGSISASSGDIEVRATLAPGGVLEIRAMAGRATVYLPASTNASLEANTFSGQITSDFGNGEVVSDRYGPSKSLRMTLGSGGGRVEIQTFSGAVRIRRAG